MLPRLIVVLCGLAAGCGGGHLPELAAGRSASYREHVEPLVLERCLSCHTFDEAKADLVLETGEGYQQLVGRRSVQVPSLELVEPGSLERSYLWHKIEGTAAVGEGMPRTLFGFRPLPDPEIERFRRWIEDGARP